MLWKRIEKSLSQIICEYISLVTLCWFWAQVGAQELILYYNHSSDRPGPLGNNLDMDRVEIVTSFLWFSPFGGCHLINILYFSDEECKRYSTTQANKAVKLSHKIDLIAAIITHVSIHDMLGLDSLTPLPRLKVAFNKTLRIVNPNEDRDPGVESGEL